MVRAGQRVAIGMTVATGERPRTLSPSQVKLRTNTGLDLPLAREGDREVPARSMASVTLQATLPNEPVQELRLALWDDLTVTVPLPAEDAATLWRPAPLRQVGLSPEPHQSNQSRIVFDTIRSEGLVTEVTYHATAGASQHLNVCAYNFQYDKCRIQEPDGTLHPLIGMTSQSTAQGGRVQGTLRFLGELDPSNTRLQLGVSATGTGTDLDPIDVTLPTHADSPSVAAAGDLTRPASSLTTPVTALDPQDGAAITITKIDVLADRVQLSAHLKAGRTDMRLRNMTAKSTLDLPSGEALPLLPATTDVPITSGTEAQAILVFQGAVPASVTELKAHMSFNGWAAPVTFTLPIPAAEAAPPDAPGTLGEVAGDPMTPQVTVTPATPAPAPTGTATPSPEPVLVTINDIQPLLSSSSITLPNPGSWVAREGNAPPPAEDPDVEAKAQQSLKDLGAQRTPDGWVLTLPETVLFDYNKFDILPGAEAKLTDIATLLSHFADAEIRVQGHTDSTGSADGNATLSKNRAEAVAQALSSKGVSPSRMAVEGYAAERPVASNATDDGKAKNRRVEIVLREKS